MTWWTQFFFSYFGSKKAETSWDYYYWRLVMIIFEWRFWRRKKNKFSLPFPEKNNNFHKFLPEIKKNANIYPKYFFHSIKFWICLSSIHHNSVDDDDDKQFIFYKKKIRQFFIFFVRPHNDDKWILFSFFGRRSLLVDFFSTKNFIPMIIPMKKKCESASEKNPY